MSFEQLLSHKVNDIETMIKEYLPKEEGFQKTIFEAMNYSMLAGGKRIRPLLMMETYRLFKGEGEGKEAPSGYTSMCKEPHRNKEIEPFIAAIEMIHSSSLVHDDLPCMDNDEYRRGKKTTWSVFGEDMGTLAGDALMIYAFETASRAFVVCNDPAKVGKCIHILARKTGIYGMIGGQTVDIELTGGHIPKDKLMFIYKLKTGALLEASMMIGAVLGGAGEEEVNLIEGIAADVGLAFQIQDDILDVTSTTEVLGKSVLSDEKNHKVTYVTLEGIDKAKSKVKFLSERAMENLNRLPKPDSFLCQLFEMLITREK